MQVGKIAIFAIFLWSAWNPVMNLLPVLSSLNFGPRADVSTLQKATNIDPLDPRPYQFWARYWLEKGLSGTPADRQKALAAIETWLQRDPASSAMQRNAGDWVWLMAASPKLQGTGSVDEDLLNLATRYYRAAEQRYPNDASMVLQLAAIQEAAGGHESAVGLAERALQIDQSHSHRDRKLEIQRIWWPGFVAADSTIGVQTGGDFMVPAPEVLKLILGSSR
jgi:tetratricopeptide (TPR) repeat protein